MRKNELSFYRMKLLIVLLMSMIIYSCKGQVDVRSKIENNASTASSSNTTEDVKDPMFYIDGQLCQHLRKIYQDSKGDLWFGTNVYDLMHYNGDGLKYITEKDGFSGGRVTEIKEDNEGNIWIATGSGLNKYDGESFTIFNESNDLLNSEIWSFLIDSKGIFWIGHNEGLSRFDGKEFEDISVPKPEIAETNTIYSANRITSIVESNDGSIWLGTDGYGICKYNDETFTHFTMENGLCDNTICELMSDSKGNLWVGTFGGGVSRFDGMKFVNYTKDGLVSGIEVGSFFEDLNGDIWFGVENNGVYKYDGNTFSHYYKNEGLDGIILDIYRDNKNRFWFGGWGGLFRYDGEYFSSVTKDGPWE